MWFESDTAYLEILIGGYTDRPWYFKTAHIGVNALSCQASYNSEETGNNFIMWDEILQTEEIVAIRDGLNAILSGATNKYVFHSEYETFAITVWTSSSGFEAIVQVQNIDGNVKEQFHLERAALVENLEYLNACCEKYPVRDAESCIFEEGCDEE